MEHFEENLSDQLLREDVEVSNIRVSMGIVKNMSSIPFGARYRQNQLKKVASFPVNKNQVNDWEFQKNCIPKKNTAKRIYSSSLPKTSDIQSDIRALLQKAIKIRHLYNVDSARSEDCQEENVSKENSQVSQEAAKKAGNNLLDKQSFICRDVTMRDVKRAH
ncbi:unnamed protein product [Moneuplotes crassus]|uniref:Uncharacterized protein n=1 Tax=Euplotes crassus TaxID=5936 RepID=A0AAD1XQP9_EUPCR|nr:unnamed protein product [Moneuplotes crassus]